MNTQTVIQKKTNQGAMKQIVDINQSANKNNLSI